MATSRIAELVGPVLGDRYRLIRPLGVGASAHVYVAEDVRLRRRVAVKLLHPALAADEGFLRRFRAEARVVAALRHPHILQVYDWGEDDRAPYLVMELLEGGSLRAMLDAGHLLSVAQAVHVGAQAARALEYAHRRGLVHRDVKPANLIFDSEGRLAVADFGLARALAEATWTEPAGAVVGTARYAAPEQARGETLDGRADVYALALVLVEATTGGLPFAADTTIGTLMARVAQPLTVPATLGPLKAVLEAAGTIDPGDRLDASGLASALDEIRGRLGPPAPLVLVGPGQGADETRDLRDPTELPSGSSPAGPAPSYPPPAPAPSRLPSWPPAASPANAWPAASREPPAGPGRRRHRRTLVAVLVAALLLAVAGAVVVTRWPKPYRLVPSLHGDTLDAARTALQPSHLGLSVTGHAYDPTIAKGSVVSQSPAAGNELREGGHVAVTVSLGPQPVRVPTDLAGKPVDTATSVLTTLGLRVGAVTYATSMTVPQGDVISTQPATGTLLPGQAVALVVSSGKPTVPVPSLAGTASGQSFVAAQAALQAAGLGAVEQDTFSDTVPKGHVIGTSPAAGVAVTVGASVTVQVSKGPDLVAVPAVRGDSVTGATSMLENAGFAVSGVTGNPTATVTGTSPPAGTLVHRGGSVQLVT